MKIIRHRNTLWIFKLGIIFLIQCMFLVNLSFAGDSLFPSQTSEIKAIDTLSPSLMVNMQQLKSIISSYDGVDPSRILFFDFNFKTSARNEIKAKQQEIEVPSDELYSYITDQVQLFPLILGKSTAEVSDILKNPKNIRVADFNSFYAYEHEGIIYIDKAFLPGVELRRYDTEFRNNDIGIGHDAWLKLIKDPASISNMLFYFTHDSVINDTYYDFNRTWALIGILKVISSSRNNISMYQAKQIVKVLCELLVNESKYAYFADNQILKAHVINTIGTIAKIYNISDAASQKEIFAILKAQTGQLNKDTESYSFAKMWLDNLKISNKTNLKNNPKRRAFQWSAHGLFSAFNAYLGQDGDTGGQHPAVLTTMKGLDRETKADMEQVLVARYVDSSDHPELTEDQQISEATMLKRIKFGPKTDEYILKGNMWKWTDQVRPAIMQLLTEKQIDLTDVGNVVFHSNYADVVSLVACQVAAENDIPSVFRIHSDGVTKMKQMLMQDKDPLSRTSWTTQDKEINLSLRILAEFMILTDLMGEVKGKCPQILVSTIEEKQRLIDCYGTEAERITVIPLGLDYEKFSRQAPAESEAYGVNRRQGLLNKILDGQQVKINGEVINQKGLIYNKPIIATISRLVPKKNVFRALKAWAEDATLKDKYNFVIAAGNLLDGDKTKEEVQILHQIYEYIKANNLEGRVSIIGSLHPHDTPELYRIIRDGENGAISPRGTMLNPAQYEPFGITVLEGMSTEIVVVATSNGGPVVTLNGDAVLENISDNINTQADNKVIKLELDSRHDFLLNGQLVDSINGVSIKEVKGQLIIQLGKVMRMSIDGVDVETLNAEPVANLDGQLVLNQDGKPLFSINKKAYGIMIGNPTNTNEDISSATIRKALLKFSSLTDQEYDVKGQEARDKIKRINSMDVEGKQTYAIYHKAQLEAMKGFLLRLSKKRANDFSANDIEKLIAILSELVNADLRENSFIRKLAVDIINKQIALCDQENMLRLAGALIDYDLLSPDSVKIMEGIGVSVKAEQSPVMDFFIQAARTVKNLLPQIMEFQQGLGQKPIIAFTGESGTGKTAIAKLIKLQMEKHGLSCGYLAQDDYYKLAPFENSKHRLENINKNVGPHEIDMDLFKQNLLDFKAGRSFTHQVFVLKNKFLAEPRYAKFDSEQYNVLIVDGAYAGDDKVKDEMDMIVFIDVAYNNEKHIELRKHRDNMRGEVNGNKDQLKILAIENQFVAPQINNAHLVIDETGAVKPGANYEKLKRPDGKFQALVTDTNVKVDADMINRAI